MIRCIGFAEKSDWIFTVTGSVVAGDVAGDVAGIVCIAFIAETAGVFAVSGRFTVTVAGSLLTAEVLTTFWSAHETDLLGTLSDTCDVVLEGLLGGNDRSLQPV